MRFESVARTHVGCRRKINEDASLSLPEKGLWAVADGMGGHDCGEVASALVVQLLADSTTQESLARRVQAAEAAIRDANARLLVMAGRDRRRTIGTTVVAVLSDGHRFACLWAGDSRAYCARDGKLSQLSRDHSLVQELVDAGQLNAADANNHPNANIITRAVGSEPRLELDKIEGQIASGDVYLLASDGLTRLLSENEILSGLKANDIASQAAKFIETCLERGAPDNVTLVIVRVS